MSHLDQKGLVCPAPQSAGLGPSEDSVSKRRHCCSRSLHTLSWGPEAQSHRSPPSGAEAEVCSQEATFVLHKDLKVRESQGVRIVLRSEQMGGGGGRMEGCLQGWEMNFQ